LVTYDGLHFFPNQFVVDKLALETNRENSFKRFSLPEYTATQNSLFNSKIKAVDF
jgi:hypothetical protein